MRIGNREIGPDKACFIVAELGINHNGSLDLAKQLIDVAVLAGCDAVKFQKRTIDLVYSPEELVKPRESPFGTTNGDLKRGLEFGFNEYSEISYYCSKKDIRWFASPWDVESVEFLEQFDFDVGIYKVASALITDFDLLRAIVMTGKPAIMSTGMSEPWEIDKAANFFLDTQTDLALLACTSTYPAKLEELNLSRIATLRELYPQCPIGYSGHEVGLWTTLCAVAMGACIIERHITLDRSMWGSDQAASIEPVGLIKLVREIRDYEKAKGSGIIRRIESEVPIMEKLRKMR